jgi:hypothetical protein
MKKLPNARRQASGQDLSPALVAHDQVARAWRLRRARYLEVMASGRITVTGYVACPIVMAQRGSGPFRWPLGWGRRGCPRIMDGDAGELREHPARDRVRYRCSGRPLEAQAARDAG